MTTGVESFDLSLSRSAFSPRDAARAGDIWRMFQDAAVIGSTRRGWDPRRYRDAGCAFVVRAMRVLHHREAAFGDRLAVRTWVSSFRRDVFSERQIRAEIDGVPLASATQEWVHVQTEPEVRATRASPALRAAFDLVEPEPDVRLPPYEEAEGASWELAFDAWYGWMDPLGHANHPQYVDWCDEAIARRIADRNGDPMAVVPVAEEVRFRSAVIAPERVTITSRPIGRTHEGDLVCAHVVRGGDQRICAEGTTVRRMISGDLAAHLGP